MGKKILSLIIVPHGKSSHRTLSFSRKTMKIAIWSAAILTVLLVAVTVDYIRMQVTRQTYRALLVENQKQKETLLQYQTSIESLNKKVEGLEAYAKKLNVIVGIKSQDVLKDVGIGPVSRASGDDQISPVTPGQISPGNLKTLTQKADDIQKNFDAASGIINHQTVELASTPTIAPAVGWQTADFGWRTDPFTQMQQFHRGIDIAGSIGSPVVATADGIVLTVSQDKLFGRSILIGHGRGFTTFYGHLNKFLVRAGQKVKRGDVIAELGNSGKATGPHVHYEIHLNDKAVNPYYYLLEEK